MRFIGIAIAEREFEYVKKTIESKNYNLKCIRITENSIENIKNIKFDTIVIDEILEKLYLKIQYLIEIMQRAQYILINSDSKIEQGIFNKINAKVITYGLNQKSTVTLSSIKDDKMLICIQRNIQTKDNNMIENGEMLIENEQIEEKNKYSLFIIFTILLIYNNINGLKL